MRQLSSRFLWTAFPFLSFFGLNLGACSSSDAPEPDPTEKPNKETPFPGQSGSFCEAPTPELGSWVSLDKELFIETVTDTLFEWMDTADQGLRPLDEGRLFDVFQEAILGTYDTRCKRGDVLEFLPPEDLTDPQVRDQLKKDIEELFEDAQVLKTDDSTVLRLSLPTCKDCEDSQDSLLTARLTKEGLLSLEFELREGELWSKQLYLSPDLIVVQGELDSLSDWGKTLTPDTRSGKVRLPQGQGKLTAVMTRSENGQLSASLGLSEFSLASAEERPLRLSSSSSCIGVYAEIDQKQKSAFVGVYTGELDLEIPGSQHCSSREQCSKQEYDGSFVYHAGEITLGLAHPPTDGDTALRVELEAEQRSTATAPGGTFAELDLGHADPKKKAFSVDLIDTPEGIRVVFEPELDLRAALVVSKLSDAFRTDWPDWLADEVFELTFGGSPKPSLLIPHRTSCDVDSNNVSRRIVQLESGTLHGLVGDDRDERVEAGQCLAQTRQPLSTVKFTSDWVEVLECE